MTLRWSWFRWLVFHDGVRIMRLRGATASLAEEMGATVRRAASEAAANAAAVASTEVQEVTRWHDDVMARLTDAVDQQRWISREIVDELLAERPKQGLAKRLADHGVDRLTRSQRDAVAFVDQDLPAVVEALNENILEAELRDQATFFGTVERSPLTEEQARAVIAFDNRVQVLAAAGSGKTSVMVARAAYAVSRGFVAPDRILLLAFNAAAAKELQVRLQERLASTGIDSMGIRASTFHAFGLGVIGKATGAKPRLARWLDDGQDIRKVLEIVDDLRDHDHSFRWNWDLYRTLYGRASNEIDGGPPDAHDKEERRPAFRTFNGELVKSEGERIIADWLYLSGVEYAYERDYVQDLASSEHGQYRPDFYYPGIDVWHEHWALDRDGNPPASFHGYLESMEWKRRQHHEYGTTLVESSWADVMDGSGLTRLQDELGRLGLEFDWNPDRPPRDRWVAPIKHEDLARLIRTFMTHVKAGGATRADIEARLESGEIGLARHRTRVFLDIYWRIHDEWQKCLAADGSIDFEYMLGEAAGHLEADRVATPYELVLVDEFQDASRARARLIRGLLLEPGRYLLAVGDDWQSINRFAGADLSVMTSFEDWFGDGPQLALTTTFRCTQTICDVARRFVEKNPNQFEKPMRSVHGPGGPPVHVIVDPEPATALERFLEQLSQQLRDGVVPMPVDGKVTVDVLGRYRFDRDVMPKRHPHNLTVQFRTVHSAKGLEADYVVLPKMVTGTYGFPSGLADDPVLLLAMPEPDDHPDAEERRLFYVALTRARRQVVIITEADRVSPFVTEILADGSASGQVTAEGLDHRVGLRPCVKCGAGLMVRRTGPHSEFLGCSTFPVCDNTEQLESLHGQVTDDRPAAAALDGSNREACARCGDGRMVQRNGPYGQFLGCSNFPRCRNSRSLS